MLGPSHCLTVPPELACDKDVLMEVSRCKLSNGITLQAAVEIVLEG